MSDPATFLSRESSPSGIGMRSSVNSSWGVPRVFQKASGGAREVPEDCREFQRIPRGWGFRGDLGVFQ